MGWGWAGFGMARKFGLRSGCGWARPSDSVGYGAVQRAGALPTFSGRWFYDRRACSALGWVGARVFVSGKKSPAG
jgi:hypothetical protein